MRLEGEGWRLEGILANLPLLRLWVGGAERLLGFKTQNSFDLNTSICNIYKKE